ncbi:ferredoxin--NADP+ reductase [Jatrophihabitans endophyticus]|uniref:ferredoxin--NADP(+) reductase n=1 Tax=Jatrophihabitans endophyticus TaxID=1206085 RepID=A0A1M5UGY2_9ACTN|nr:FAD-dependent oxidoreductase [Jatrophihabitans endophyticus]SHH62274.1 ferredoxin--NADP+ reductase [Jatrophihabitans endophyticus]
MSYVITQNCCKDASCVSVCPVNCIAPVPGQDAFVTEPMLYVDPRACIDCGACADACPVDAIVPADTLTGAQQRYERINAEHFAAQPVASTTDGPLFRAWDRPHFDWSLPSDFAGLDVAVVGTGPAGLYAAELLLLHTRSTVTLIDRLPTPGGLIRYGVAPDHPGTKRIGETFARLYTHPRVRMRLGTEVGDGTDGSLTPDDLAARHDAVIYAVGASVGRRLGLPGESLPGSLTGPEAVGWYNGHPDVAADAVRLDRPRAVVVGTGNVALDVARILTAAPGSLAGTAIAGHALAGLRDSALHEVVLLARRGPDTAAYTAPELLALRERPDVELVVDDHDPAVAATIDAAPSRSHAALLAGVARRRVDHAAEPRPGRRIVLRFHTTVERYLGEGRVEGVRLADGTDVLAGSVVTAIGYHGRGVPGLPFDDAAGTVPHDGGRIAGVPGAYAVGWWKRGSSGGIGDNRADAAETVRTLLDDAVAGRLPGRSRRAGRFSRTR